jgi:aromatic amino acid aminotransferase I
MKGITDTSAVSIPDPLTLNGVPGWREKMAKMPTGVAPACSSDMFKSPVCSPRPGQYNTCALCGEMEVFK